MNWIIRTATTEDIPTLVDFNCAIARESEGKELTRDVVTRGVSRGLLQGEEVAYYVVDDGHGPIGCLMLTREWSDWRDGWLAWVQSVYVKPQYRGQGVFRMLLTHVRDKLREQPDVVGLRLYVEAENTRAQTVYRNTGFVDPNYLVLEQIF